LIEEIEIERKKMRTFDIAESSKSYGASHTKSSNAHSSVSILILWQYITSA
jgi:hypothetical protein